MLASVHYTDLQFITFCQPRCITIMNAFKGTTNSEPLFPEQYFEFKTQHHLSVKNVLLEIQVDRSTHPHLSLLLLCVFMTAFRVNFLFCTFSKYSFCKLKQSRYRPGLAQRVPGS
jgi:hypothetical protein